MTESLRAMVVVERSVESNGIECEYELKMICLFTAVMSRSHVSTW